LCIMTKRGLSFMQPELNSHDTEEC